MVYGILRGVVNCSTAYQTLIRELLLPNVVRVSWETIMSRLFSLSSPRTHTGTMIGAFIKGLVNMDPAPGFPKYLL